MPAPSEVADWARSGAMALTGRADGPPLLAPGRAASSVREQLATLGRTHPGILGERAAYAGLTRRGPWSCGGAMRVLPSRDGHVALSLARADDVALVPALVESSSVDDPWEAVASWAAAATAHEIDERFALLGLPGGAVRRTPPERAGVLTTRLGSRTPRERPLVVDLTSLWAGPLCAHLLGSSGARVVKVESRSRPDGARSGPLTSSPCCTTATSNGSSTSPTRLTSSSSASSSPKPIWSSKPPDHGALRQLGLVAEDVVADGTSWLSITACGRASDAVGFGDDVAARAGLVVADRDDLLPVGDAIADPLAGVRAATEAAAALASTGAVLIDLTPKPQNPL